MDPKVDDINLTQAGEDNFIKGPMPQSENSMSKAAFVLGVAAVISCFMTVYVPVILGALAAVLALLGKTGETFSKQAKTGIGLGLTAIALNVLVIGFSLYTYETDPQTHEQVNIMYENMYGETLDEMLEDAKEGNLTLDQYSYAEDL